MAQGIYARFSPAELAKLQAKAEEAGMTQSAFVRASALQALKQADLDARLVVAVQAEVRTALDWFLDNYQSAQASTADALSEVLSGIMATTKQAINPPKLDMTEQAIRDIQERARVQGRELSQAERVDIARLQGHRPAHVPGAPD